jgi:hypothetical protein
MSSYVRAVLLLVFCQCATVPHQRLDDRCKVRISTLSGQYRTAGDVSLQYEPEGVAEIPIILPWPENFFAVDLLKEPAWGESQSRGARSHVSNYPAEPRVPSFVWNRVRTRVADGRYALPPGTFQLVLRYDSGGAPCYAVTKPFVLQEPTFWVSTEVTRPQ